MPQNAPSSEQAPLTPQEQELDLVQPQGLEEYPDLLNQDEFVALATRYLPKEDKGLLEKAYQFCQQCHEGQFRASGEPYYIHPVQVATILARMRLDRATLITALLHDTVEDTEASLENIKETFGEDVASLVDGVTKLSQIDLQNAQRKQAENFRKLLLAMSRDIRVLLVKLADRLDNMRTLHFLKKEEKRARIARETMEIYAPLAERIGLHRLKEELEGRSFKELYPEAFEAIHQRLETMSITRVEHVERILEGLQDVFKKADVNVAVSGRVKSPYSIWRKMQKKNVSFDQLSDIVAFRALVLDIGDCYQALGALHRFYPVVPNRFKDYISTPKGNHYQSLHTGLYGPEGVRIEVQIRTKEMHRQAEYGVAAHWSYKRGSAQAITEGKQYRWMRHLLDILENTDDLDEFLEHTKLEIYQDQAFCFTPKGDLIPLAHNATVLDFSYAVHTEVGNKTTGARVGGKFVPLDYKLKNGDQVDIITSPHAKPSLDWEKIAVTGKAKAAIRRHLRQTQRPQFEELGLRYLKEIHQTWGLKFLEKPFEPLFEKYKCDSIEDLYYQIGLGGLSALELVGQIYPERRLDRQKKEVKERKNLSPLASKKMATTHFGVPIIGLESGIALHFSKCCHPIPGDSITGIISTGKGVSIHRQNCFNLKNFESSPERWIPLSWDGGKEVLLIARLIIVVENKPDSLAKVVSVISKKGADIRDIRVVQRSQEYCENLIEIDIATLEQLKELIARLRSETVVISVERQAEGTE